MITHQKTKYLSINSITIILVSGLIFSTIVSSKAMDITPDHHQVLTTEDLPNDFLVEVFNILSIDDCLNIETVSKRFQTLICSTKASMEKTSWLKSLKGTGLLFLCTPNHPQDFKNDLIKKLKLININKKLDINTKLKLLLAQYSATHNVVFAKEFVDLYNNSGKPHAFTQVIQTMQKRIQENN